MANWPFNNFHSMAYHLLLLLFSARAPPYCNLLLATYYFVCFLVPNLPISEIKTQIEKSFSFIISLSVRLVSRFSKTILITSYNSDARIHQIGSNFKVVKKSQKKKLLSDLSSLEYN